MQDIRKYIDIVSEQPTPQVGDAFDLEFGDNTAVISTTIEKIGEDSVTVLAVSYTHLTLPTNREV